MKKIATFLALIFFLLASAAAYAATVDVSMQNNEFQPKTIVINAGDTVKWTNNETALSGTFHTVTSGTGCTPNGMWNSGFIVPDQSFEMTFNTPGTFPYFCSIHCAQFGMTGTVIVNTVPTQMDVPTSPRVFSYQGIASPVTNTNPSLAMPIGLGSVATGGHTLSVTLEFTQFTGPVDIYFLLYLPAIDRDHIFEFTSEDEFRELSDGLFPFIANTMGPVDEHVFFDIPTFFLPRGQYIFAVLVTPAGNQSLSAFYLWITEVTIS